MDKDTSVRTSSGRKKMRINFIDIILILIIVAAVAVLGYIILSPQINISSKAEAVTIQYQVEIVHLREEWKDNVEIGDDFIDYTTMESIGTVVDVRCSDRKVSFGKQRYRRACICKLSGLYYNDYNC